MGVLKTLPTAGLVVIIVILVLFVLAVVVLADIVRHRLRGAK